MVSPGDITLLLHEAAKDRPGALDELMGLVYADLERLAVSHLSRRFGAQARTLTLEPAALVNESFLRLIRQRKAFENRGQFFAIATKVILRVIIDYQRQRLAEKRGAGRRRICLYLDGRPDPGGAPGDTAVIELESLVRALERLESIDPRRAEVVKMRTVWGFDVNEIAEALGTSASTIKRDWRFARAWLLDETSPPDR